MSVIRTTNNPAMLIWAREEVGYSIEEASDALGLSLDTLIAAESGKHQLTLGQLRKAAEKYEVPFGFFYFSEPPYKSSFKPIPDYRIEPGLVGANHHRLALEIKKCRDRRELFLDIEKSLDEQIEQFKTIETTLEKSPDVGLEIRARLGVTNHEISLLNFDNCYSYWKNKIEEDGVLVYESQYIPDETGVIGLAIFYEVAPIILIKRGPLFNERKLFTLLHEYAHILKGKSAINDVTSLSTDSYETEVSTLETDCNKLASEILVPSKYIEFDTYTNLSAIEKMEKLARVFKVTYSTAVVCLRRVGLISYPEQEELLEIRRKIARQKKDDNKGKEASKIPREILNKLDMGRPLFTAVLGAYSEGLLDVFDASKILNLRVNKIDKLVREFQ